MVLCFCQSTNSAKDEKRKFDGERNCIDCSKNRQDIIKKLKLERLQEIRRQEKLLSQERSLKFAQLKEKQKNERKEESKKRKFDEQISEYQKQCATFAEAMVTTGASHRSADQEMMKRQFKAKEMLKRQQKLSQSQQQREKVARAKRSEEIGNMKFPLKEAQQRRELRLEQGHIDREAAVLVHENTLARQQYKVLHERQAMVEKENQRREMTQRLTTQSAESIEYRGRIPIQAKIIRHGLTPQSDETLVTNDFIAAKERQQQVVKKKLHQELHSQVNVNKRYSTAQKLATEQKELRIINDEFQFLEKIDLSGSRTHRLNNREKVIQFQQQEESALLHSHINKTKFRTPTILSNETSQRNFREEKERYFSKVFERSFLNTQTQQPPQEQEQGDGQHFSQEEMFEVEGNQMRDEGRIDHQWKSFDERMDGLRGANRNHSSLQSQFHWEESPQQTNASSRVPTLQLVDPSSSIASPSQTSIPDLQWSEVNESQPTFHETASVSSADRSSEDHRPSAQRKPLSVERSQDDYISTLYKEALQTARDVFESTFLHHRRDLLEDHDQSDEKEQETQEQEDDGDGEEEYTEEDQEDESLTTSLTESHPDHDRHNSHDDHHLQLGYHQQQQRQQQWFVEERSEEDEDDPAQQQRLSSPEPETTDFSTKYFLSYKHSSFSSFPLPSAAAQSNSAAESARRRDDHDQLQDHDSEWSPVPPLSNASSAVVDKSADEVSEFDGNSLSSDREIHKATVTEISDHFYPPHDVSDDSLRIDPSRYLQYLPTERVAPTLPPATLSKAELSVGSEVVSSSQHTNGSVSHSRSSLQMSLSLSADPAPATEHELFPPPPPSAPPSPLETHDSRPETPPPLRLFVSTTPPSCESSVSRVQTTSRRHFSHDLSFYSNTSSCNNDSANSSLLEKSSSDLSTVVARHDNHGSYPVSLSFSINQSNSATANSFRFGDHVSLDNSSSFAVAPGSEQEQEQTLLNFSDDSITHQHRSEATRFRDRLKQRSLSQRERIQERQQQAEFSSPPPSPPLISGVAAGSHHHRTEEFSLDNLLKTQRISPIGIRAVSESQSSSPYSSRASVSASLHREQQQEQEQKQVLEQGRERDVSSPSLSLEEIMRDIENISSPTRSLSDPDYSFEISPSRHSRSSSSSSSPSSRWDSSRGDRGRGVREPRISLISHQQSFNDSSFPLRTRLFSIDVNQSTSLLHTSASSVSGDEESDSLTFLRASSHSAAHESLSLEERSREGNRDGDGDGIFSEGSHLSTHSLHSSSSLFRRDALVPSADAAALSGPSDRTIGVASSQSTNSSFLFLGLGEHFSAEHPPPVSGLDPLSSSSGLSLERAPELMAPVAQWSIADSDSGESLSFGINDHLHSRHSQSQGQLQSPTHSNLHTINLSFEQKYGLQSLPADDSSDDEAPTHSHFPQPTLQLGPHSAEAETETADPAEELRRVIPSCEATGSSQNFMEHSSSPLSSSSSTSSSLSIPSFAILTKQHSTQGAPIAFPSEPYAPSKSVWSPKQQHRNKGNFNSNSTGRGESESRPSASVSAVLSHSMLSFNSNLSSDPPLSHSPSPSQSLNSLPLLPSQVTATHTSAATTTISSRLSLQRFESQRQTSASVSVSREHSTFFRDSTEEFESWLEGEAWRPHHGFDSAETETQIATITAVAVGKDIRDPVSSRPAMFSESSVKMNFSSGPDSSSSSSKKTTAMEKEQEIERTVTVSASASMMQMSFFSSSSESLSSSYLQTPHSSAPAPDRALSFPLSPSSESSGSIYWDLL